MLWDVYCRVIDNHGDVGVCWRLARALVREGQQVRLWIDDASALAWMAPGGAPGITVLPWPADGTGLPPAGDVVVEAFGCDLPASTLASLAEAASASRRPVWLNLEYLSAEGYVERSHGLRSPQFSGPATGLDKWFFYPGFTARTGGLLHRDVVDEPAEAARAWVAAQGWGTRPGERAVLLFGYANPALPGLLQLLADQPTLLRVPPGPLQAQLAQTALPPALRWQALPAVPQTDFDRLLAASDLNLVRGEDSFVRAQVASAGPFLWQIYPQHDGAHAPKLQAFVDRMLADTAPALAAAVRASFLAINGLAPWPQALPAATAWAAAQARWRARLRASDDLAQQLIGFVAEHR